MTGRAFESFAPFIKRRFEDELDARQPELVAKLSEIFQRTLKEFDSFTIVPDIQDPKRDELRAQVAAYVDGVRETFHKVIRPGLAEAKTAGARMKTEK